MKVMNTKYSVCEHRTGLKLIKNRKHFFDLQTHRLSDVLTVLTIILEKIGIGKNMFKKKLPLPPKFSPNPNVFCALPFIHINNRTNGQFNACCQASGPIFKENGEAFNITHGDTFEQAFHSTYMQTLRENMLAGERDPRCSSCWNLEDIGIRSKRVSDGNRFLKQGFEKLASKDPIFSPLSWDIKLGSNCNLKCRMCHHETSAAIMTEAIKHGWISSERGKGYLKSNGDFLNYPHFREELERIIEYVEEIYLLGGEPTLIRKHLEIIDLAILKGLSKKIDIRWSTNLSYFDDAFIQRAKNFKSITLDCSVDGFGLVNDYIRHGSIWKEFETSLFSVRAALPNALIKCICTIQIYNVFQIERLTEWAKTNNVSLDFNYLTVPSYLSTHCLPGELKKRLITKYESMSDDPCIKDLCLWLDSADDSRHFKAFLSYTKKLDLVRNQDFLGLIPPEYHSFFQQI